MMVSYTPSEKLEPKVIDEYQPSLPISEDEEYDET